MSTNVLHLNNKAVNCLRDGKLRNAMTNLRLGLVQMREIFANTLEKAHVTSSLSLDHNECGEQNHGSKEEFVSSKDYEEKESTVLSIPIRKWNKKNASSSSMLPSSYDTVFTFFDRAFALSAAANSDFLSDNEQSKVTMVMLYNSGLIHHIHALNNNYCPKELKKAQSFYNMALSIVMNDGIDDDKISSDDNLLLFALLNNTGHIHSHLVNISMIRQCQYYLREIANELFACCEISVDEDLHSFLTNVLVMSQELSSAPAA